MKRCHLCGGKFGLVRHHYVRHSFCSRRCVERFSRAMAEEIRRHKAGQLEGGADVEQMLHTSGFMRKLDQPERTR
jgi:hypothetical protein